MQYFQYEEPVFRPPSEARSLILQMTIGCSHNRCKFCGMYKSKRFRVRSIEAVAAEIAAVPEVHRRYYQRVFLADGDALIYPQQGLIEILDLLRANFANLTRVAAYASPNSLTTKSIEELRELNSRKLRILYFGLESGDPFTLRQVDKGFSPEKMLELCYKAQSAGLKLSITAILGLAGRVRSREHAVATADWINRLSPAYFSLLTMFRRNNDAYFEEIQTLKNGEIIEEALAMVKRLNPEKTILRSNHVSNVLNLAGSYPKDRDRLIAQTEAVLLAARSDPHWFNQLPAYGEGCC